MRPTILIGIGTGGLRSIEAAWKLSQEIPSTISPDQRPLVEYIYLETDSSSKPASNDIVACPLILKDISASQNAVIQDISATSGWVANQRFSDNVMTGAGGSPVVGRMTLWDKNNRQFFQNSLNNAIRRFNERNISKPLVYIVGSFGGGTGSGTFLDIAYIVRDALANQVEVQGLFMIPNTNIGDRVIYSNTICCIKELAYYNDENHEFPFKWNANPPKGYEKQNQPYDLVQIISAAYNEALATVSYSQLHEEAGLFLYLNMLGLCDVRDKSLVDATGNIIVSKYTTYGLAALHYPENEIKELIGNKFAAELLGNIVDNQHYYDKDEKQRKPISTSIAEIRNDVMRSFDKEFTGILHTWCDTIEVVEGSKSMPVEMHIESLSKTLASGNSSYDEKRKTLYSFFKVGGEYYRQLKNQCDASALDSLIKLVTDKVSDALKEYQNINVAQNALDAVQVSIEEILKFWQENGYQKDPSKWNSLLRRDIVDDILPMPTTFKMQFESVKVYYDRIKYQLLYGLAMHVFSESLEKVLKAIKGEKDSLGNRIVVTDTKGHSLPSKYQLAVWKKLVSDVRANPDSSYDSCIQVADALTAKLSKASNGNIEYLFPEGNLDETRKKIEWKYITAHGDERSIVDVTGNNDLYQFLMSIKPQSRMGQCESEKDLYSKVTQGYINGLDMGFFSVADAIKDGTQMDRISLIVERAKIPHVPINPAGRNAQFQEHKNIPHVLAGFDGSMGTALDQISKMLQDSNLQGFEIGDADRNKFSHIGLNNWLIFYKEFGRMSDDLPFNIIDDLRDFENYSVNFAADMQGSGLSEQAYHEKRMPYIPYRTCQEFAREYIYKAGELYKKDEWEEAVQMYKYAHYWDMNNNLPESQKRSISDLISQEDGNHRFNRYMGIGNRYFQEGAYKKAETYYKLSEKIRPGDSDVNAQLNRINSINSKVVDSLAEGERACIIANISYNECLQNKNKDVETIEQCIRAYEEILDKYYEPAFELDHSQNEIQNKIASLKGRIDNLRNLINQ